jgi:hypothetical protein
MSRLLAPARIIMPSRVFCTTGVERERDDEARRRREDAVPRVLHQGAEAKAAAEPRRRRHAVDVVADEDRAQLLEDEDERVGQQHLLEVVALVEEAEERPLEQVAEDRGERDAGDEPRHEPVAEPGREREREVRAEHVEAAVREVDDAHDPEDQRQTARDEEEQQPVLDRVQALDEEGGEIHRLRFSACEVTRAAAAATRTTIAPTACSRAPGRRAPSPRPSGTRCCCP